MESWDIAMLSMSLGSVVSLSFCFFKFWVNQALPIIFQMSLIWAFVAETTLFFPRLCLQVFTLLLRIAHVWGELHFNSAD